VFPCLNVYYYKNLTTKFRIRERDTNIIFHTSLDLEALGVLFILSSNRFSRLGALDESAFGVLVLNQSRA